VGDQHLALALTLTIGSGAIALAQVGAITTVAGTQQVTPTISAASTAGTLLLAGLTSSNSPITAAPSGWTLLSSVAQSTNSRLEIWHYPNNPGGILAVPFTQSGAKDSAAVLSEWRNVAFVSVLETSGTATATAGTTLTLTASAATVNSGDLALAGWGQVIGAPGAVTFTTPNGWTRLIDNGSNASLTGHTDYEYLIAPPTGNLLTPTLTSTGTTTSASGVVLLLRAAAPAIDISAFVAY